MEVDCLPYKDTGYFSSLICDYLEGKESLKPFYQYSPNIAGLGEALHQRNFSKVKREQLVQQLKWQYNLSKIDLNKATKVDQNINLLQQENSFTVCTGHQLSLFTGPLYFIYKICSVIKTCQELKKHYPDNNFIPVFWMASEDHDWEEVNHFKLGEKKIAWETDQKGPVGRMKLQGMEDVFTALEKELVEYSGRAEELKELFKQAYLKQDNLSNATRLLTHRLFSDYGLVILDGDDKVLKQSFAPLMKEELLYMASASAVESQSKALGEQYKLQVNPREINLFYLKDGLRERISLSDSGNYEILNTTITFKENELLDELEKHPERFSPNVILRPLYQEVVLPNLAYIGGGGELAYWFQLKATFEHFKVDFPVLLLRNSLLFISSKNAEHINSLGFENRDLFEDESILLKKWIVNNSEKGLLLSAEKDSIQKNLEQLRTKVLSIDKGLERYFAAIEKKHFNNLEQLSEKLIRAERKKNESVQNQIKAIKSEAFPKGGLQERKDNFTMLYMWYGSSIIDKIIELIEMPSLDFTIVKS